MSPATRRRLRATAAGPFDLSASDPDYLSRVDREITAYVERVTHRCTPTPESTTELARHLATACDGGKRLRPILVEAAYRGFGGSDADAPVLLGAAFEMLHSALLIHDDVIDQDDLRRGQPNIRATYRDRLVRQGTAEATAAHAGDAVAIVAGDVLLTGSVRLAARAAARSTQPDLVDDCFEEAVVASAAGELEDVLLACRPADSPLTPQQVLDMESLKTAAYSFDAPLRAGALLAGASPDEAAGLGAIGRRFGLAYQIVDDLLGTFGDTARTGKPSDSDLLEGKVTVVTAFGIARDPGLAAILEKVRAGLLPAATARAALRHTGADRHAYGLAADLVDEGVSLADSQLPAGPMASTLVEIGRRVLDREA
ncbi:polyprenyl synthetase family protein [Zhihengliuella halotolerans]|uniref:Geranylgeranyl diphosphate synthase type II n=1 Tax=Zhihengliuella halotolerans TaxID=370736 RepID=A0A4Q8AFJ1_9MICC|nr:polyprenyl synthetase family protein [Zhihengliuella halotolerans]RZU62994.1 geranylgeranyl diphosphate synthase type II [Zhihengliuella halotolerans]